MSSTVFAVNFDAHDAQAVASFWAAVLGRTVADGATGDNAATNADRGQEVREGPWPDLEQPPLHRPPN